MFATQFKQKHFAINAKARLLQQILFQEKNRKIINRRKQEHDKINSSEAHYEALAFSS
jgi:hypothetical protein